jgi:hypothetical protein
LRQKGIYNYFVFGFNYGVIKRTGLQGEPRDVALDYLNEFFEFLAELELQVTERVASDLEDILKTIRDGEAERIDASLDAELQLKKAYVLTKKRYPLESLLTEPSALLANGVHDRLSDNAKRDYRLACLQVALNQPTAAAFHLMRMLEEQVKSLYFSFKKTKRLEKPMWGPMTQQLRSKRAPKPSNKWLDHLDSMRIRFRNPTQHPQAFYSIDEAQDLLNQTIVAVNMIHAEVPKSAPVTSGLTPPSSGRL